MTFYLVSVLSKTHNFNLIMKNTRQLPIKTVYIYSELYSSAVKFI